MTTFLPQPSPRGGDQDDSNDVIEDALRELPAWNVGVLGSQVLQWHITPEHIDIGPVPPGGSRGISRGIILQPRVKPKIDHASYQAVQMALSGVFKQILHKLAPPFHSQRT